LFWGLVDQFKEDTGKPFEQAIKNAVSFHVLLGLSITQLTINTVSPQKRKIPITTILTNLTNYELSQDRRRDRTCGNRVGATRLHQLTDHSIQLDWVALYSIQKNP
jgi:hypothetical protein